MFGHNEITGQKFFINEDRLLVSSIFMTLQGEGPYSGRPSIFIRLSKCNLRCSFCDTYFDDGEWMTSDEILQNIENIIASKFPQKSIYDFGVVITGGEPLLQKSIETFLLELSSYYDVHKHPFTQIESNGIIHRDLPWFVTLVISPKINETYEKYLKPHKNNLIRADCLKFLVESEGLYSSIPEWALMWKEETGKPIYISPINVYNNEPKKAKIQHSFNNQLTLEERSDINEVISFWEDGLLNLNKNRKNHEYAAKYCLEHGLFLSLQQHLYTSIA